MKRTLSLAAALSVAAAAVPALAQQAAYRPLADTLYLRSVNEYRVYVVRGADTVGSPVSNLYVERQTWAEEGARLRMVSRRSDLDVGRGNRVDTFVVTPAGAVETINGETDAEGGQYDAFPRLPAGRPLAPGTAWSDTITRTRAKDGGEYAYTAVRSYRVAGPAPDGRGVRVEATGQVRYRDVYAVGEGGRWTIDVSGPMTAAFTFDPAEGRLRGQEWRMELRGTAAVPRQGGGVETIPAGLVSSLEQRPVEAEAARRLIRDLPGRDTSHTTLDGGVVVLHTVTHGGETIESGMARNDGTVGTARTTLERGGFRSYRVVWTDAAGATELLVEPRGSRRLHVSGARETNLELPRDAFWGVADYGMEEHLAPTLLSLPDGTAGIPLSVYRPQANRWDTYKAAVGNVNGVRLVTLTDEAGASEHLLLTSDGDLLVDERVGQGQRRPLRGSRRAERLEDLMAAARGARGEPPRQ